MHHVSVIFFFHFTDRILFYYEVIINAYVLCNCVCGFGRKDPVFVF